MAPFLIIERFLDWLTTILNSWAKNHPKLTEDDTSSSPEADTSRMKYLDQIYRKYSLITIPTLSIANRVSIQAIFQPLNLRREPDDFSSEGNLASLSETANFLSDPDFIPLGKNNHQPADILKQTIPTVITNNCYDALSLSRQPRLVILGGPGAGKTTLLRALVSQAAQTAQSNLSAPLPIFVSLPDLASSDKTFSQYLLDMMGDAEVNKSSVNLLWQAVENGRALLCLDGLDEVASSLQPSIIRMINEQSSGSGNMWIVTSRFTEYKDQQIKLEQFTEWELLPMDHVMRRELAHRLLEELDQTSSAQLSFLNALESQIQDISLYGNPLLFSLAVLVFAVSRTSSINQAEICYYTIEAFLQQREPVSAQREILRAVLATLALKLYSAKEYSITRKELFIFIQGIRDEQQATWDARMMVRSVIASGILEVLTDESYGFWHIAFQEYLVALALAQKMVNKSRALQEEARIIIWKKRTSGRWENVLKLLVAILVREYGEDGKFEALRWLRALLRQRLTPEGDLGDLGLLLALKSLNGEAGWTIHWREAKETELAEEIAVTWIDALFDAVRLKRRQQRRLLESFIPLISRVSTYNPNMPLDKLTAALRDQDVVMQQTAVGLLKALGRTVSIDRLLAMLNNGDWSIRAAAICASGKRIPLERLVEALNDENEFVRLVAVQSFTELQPEVPVDHLIALVHDYNSDVRVTAVKALGSLGERAPVDPLMEALKDDNWQVRLAAVDVLGKKRELESDVLLVALGDEDQFVRETAAKAIKALGEEITLDLLQNTLINRCGISRTIVAEVLTALGERTPVELLRVGLRSDDLRVRLNAIRALSNSREHESVEQLMAMLSDHNSKVRAAAVEALGAHCEAAQIELLEVALGDEDATVRAAAVWALSRLGERTPIEPLLTALSDKDKNVRSTAIQALASLKERVAIEPLIAALHDESIEVRLATLSVLSRLGERVPIEPLLAALQDEDSRIRAAAVSALGALQERTPLEPLLLALEDESSEVRTAAVLALSQQGERTPVEQLVSALQEVDEQLRATAAYALGTIKKDIPVESLVAAMGDSQGSVRTAAMWALKRTHPDVLLAVSATAVEILMKHESETVFDSWAQGLIAEAIGNLGQASPIFLEKLTKLLDWPYWQVQMKAAQALGKLRYNIPDAAFRGLYHLRHHSQPQAVRYAADDALTEILRVSGVTWGSELDDTRESQAARSKDILISYANADSQWAEWIAWQLETAGYSTKLQVLDFRTGSGKSREIEGIFNEADSVIIILSISFLSLLSSQPPLNDALKRSVKIGQKVFLPVRVEKCEITDELLGPVAYIDLTGLDALAARESLLAGAQRRQGDVMPIHARSRITHPLHLEPVIAQQLPVRTKKCLRALFIGLGGAGNEVVRHVRREMLQHGYSVPFFQYLVLDTVPFSEFSYSDPLMHLKNGEEYLYIGGYDPNEVLKNINQWPSISQWWGTRPQTNLPTIDEGAGQLRAVGRMSFFCHFREIYTQLQRMVYEVMSAANREEALLQGYEVPNYKAPIIYLVFSLCGGTGSSLFLDVAYILRELFASAGVHPTIVAVATLPGPYIQQISSIPQQERLQANAYAALQELERLHTMAIGQLPRLNRDFIWDVQYTTTDRVSSAELPFDYIYLINDTTVHGEQYRLEEIYSLISQAIFWLTGPPTAAQFWERAKNLFSNTLASGGQPDAAGFVRLAKYSSFGVSTVAIDIRIDQAQRELAHRILDTIRSFKTEEQKLPIWFEKTDALIEQIIEMFSLNEQKPKGSFKDIKSVVAALELLISEYEASLSSWQSSSNWQDRKGLFTIQAIEEVNHSLRTTLCSRGPITAIREANIVAQRLEKVRDELMTFEPKEAESEFDSKKIDEEIDQYVLKDGALRSEMSSITLQISKSYDGRDVTPAQLSQLATDAAQQIYKSYLKKFHALLSFEIGNQIIEPTKKHLDTLRLSLRDASYLEFDFPGQRPRGITSNNGHQQSRFEEKILLTPSKSAYVHIEQALKKIYSNIDTVVTEVLEEAFKDWPKSGFSALNALESSITKISLRKLSQLGYGEHVLDQLLEADSWKERQQFWQRADYLWSIEQDVGQKIGTNLEYISLMGIGEDLENRRSLINDLLKDRGEHLELVSTDINYELGLLRTAHGLDITSLHSIRDLHSAYQLMSNVHNNPYLHTDNRDLVRAEYGPLSYVQLSHEEIINRWTEIANKIALTDRASSERIMAALTQYKSQFNREQSSDTLIMVDKEDHPIFELVDTLEDAIIQQPRTPAILEAHRALSDLFGLLHAQRWISIKPLNGAPFNADMYEVIDTKRTDFSPGQIVDVQRRGYIRYAPLSTQIRKALVIVSG